MIISDVVENDTIKSAVLSNPYIDPEHVSYSRSSSHYDAKTGKLAKFGNLTLKFEI